MFNVIIINKIQINIQKIYHGQVALSLKNIWFNIHKPINIIKHKNGLKDENHIIISTDKEIVLEKIQHALLIKFLEDLRLKWTFLHIVKVMYKKYVVDFILNRPKLKQFLSSQKWDRYVHNPHSVSILCSKY